MPFDQEQVRVPVAIGNIEITLRDFVDPDIFQSASFKIGVVFSDGSIARRSGDLIPEITPVQRQALSDFMTSLRAQAENELLP